MLVRNFNGSQRNRHTAGGPPRRLAEWKIENSYFWAVAIFYCLLSTFAVSAAVAAPTMTGGSVSGAAGTIVTLPITFNVGSPAANVASLQFNLTLPASLSSGTVTAGSILTAAGKSVSTSFNSTTRTWTFIVFGLNQNTIASGTLLTAQIRIAPGTPPGTLSVPFSSVVYSDPAGLSIPAGTSTAGTVTVTASVSIPVITSAGTASGTVGTAFSYQIIATNNPTSFNATGLPGGLSINTGTGLISGTPTAAGTSNVTLSATNTAGTGTKALTLTVSVGVSTPVITSAGTASGTVGTAFSYQIIATNSPTSFGATGLPTGLSVNTGTGLISGTPTTAGTSNVTLRAINAAGTGTKALTLTVSVGVSTPVITSAGTASGTVGTAFNYQITATNNPTSFGATGLPAGLSVNTGTGLISGTPTAAGTSNVTLRATNSAGIGIKVLTLTISAIAASPTLTGGSVSGAAGTTVTFPITFNAGIPAASVAGIQFNLTLPSSLSTGTVTAGSILTAAGKSVSTSFSGNTWTFVIFGLNQNIIASGSLLTAQMRIAPGTAAGTLSIPFSAVAYANPSGGSITAGTSTAGTVTVTGGVSIPVITSAGTASGIVGTAFSYQITATNNPTSFDALGLPSGLSINTGTGLISGTPTIAGTSNVTLRAINAAGTGTKALTLTITGVPVSAPVILSAGSASGAVGTAFSYQITATNNPTSFGATGLPGGLSVNTGTGLISGTPTTAGISTVTLRAINSVGTGTKALTLTVTLGGLVPVITAQPQDQSVNVGQPAIFSITASGSAPLKYQWQFKVSGAASFTDIPGAIGSSYTFFSVAASDSGTQIRCVVSNSAGTLTSNAATLTVSSTGMTLPMPTLNLPKYIPVNGNLTVGYPSGYSNIGFSWTITATASYSTSKGIGARGVISKATSASFQTSGNVAALAGYALVPGAYLVTVQAFDSSGNQSPIASADVTLVQADFSGLRVFPNPWRSDRHTGTPVTFDHLPLGSTVKIFTVSGHALRTLTPALDTVSWDLTNDKGDKVASGLYLYVITVGSSSYGGSDEKARGQIAVIK